MPDIAGDLRKAVAAISACSDSLCRAVSAPVTGRRRAGIEQELTEAAIATYAHKTTGNQKETLIDVLHDSSERILDTEQEALARELSAITGIPEAAVRSRVGWDQVLRAEGSARTGSRLPNTPNGRKLARLQRVQDALESTRKGAAADSAALAWESTERSGTFDSTIEELRARNHLAPELGWAILTFETHKHVKLIWHQANKLARTFPDRTASDLLGWGWLGLRVALRQYDPELGFTFSTYACSRIIGSIRDGVRSENPMPKRLNTFTRKVAAAEAQLTQALGRNPSLEEVSERIGVGMDALAILPRTAPQASVDEILAGMSERGGTPSWNVDPVDPAELAVRSAAGEAVRSALGELSPEDAQAVQLLVMEGLNPTEARGLTGASARQLRQRKERGLAALKGYLEHWDNTEE